MAANDNQADMNQHMNDPSQHPALSLSATFLKPWKEKLSGQEYESLQWLASLRTLGQVPFQYMVPSEDMLPNETIRFFHVDRNWLDSLIDGALSVALVTSREKQWLFEEVNSKTQYTRIIETIDVLENFINEYRYDSYGELDRGLSKPMSGFLFRSSIVRDHPGLEVSAYESSDNPEDAMVEDNRVPINRMIRLSESVLLVTFSGIPTHIRIQEPSEGIRLGFDSTGGDGIYLKMKNSEGVVQTGSTWDVQRRVGTDTVLDINSLQAAIDASHAIAPLGFDSIDSAAVATQLLQFPYQQDFVPYQQMHLMPPNHPHKGSIQRRDD